MTDSRSDSSAATRRFLIWILAAICAGAAFAGVPAEDVAALVDGRPITARQVDEAIAAKLFALEQQKYALRKSALDSLVAAAILEKEARAKGVTPEQLRASLTSAALTVTADEIEKAYRDNASALSFLSADEARERLRLDLESQQRMRRYREAMTSFRERAVVEVRLQAPRLSSDVASDSPLLGRKDAPVTIVMFSDFECGYCKSAQGVVKQLLAEYPDEVALVHRNLPLDGHALALPAARASHCAAEQGRFWEYHDALFAAPSLSNETLRAAAARAGLDAAKLAACAGSDAAAAVVTRDVESARRAGITGTPSYVINGRVVPGAASLETLREIVAAELQRGSPPATETHLSQR